MGVFLIVLEFCVLLVDSIELGEYGIDTEQLYKSPYYSELFHLGNDLKRKNDVYYVGETPSDENCYIIELNSILDYENVNTALAKLRDLIDELGGDLRAEYNRFVEMKCLKVCFPDNFFPLEVLERVKWINHIERDQIVRSAQIQNPVDWGLSCIGGTGQNTSFGFDATGTGVSVYILDTGIQEDHPEFKGRLKRLYNALNDIDNKPEEECTEHGTRVASLLGGINLGVAKNCTMYNIQVLDCQGVGTISDVICGLNYVFENSIPRSIINISLGGPHSDILDRAVSEATNMGYLVVSAAGNNGNDACNCSPGSSKDSIIVGSIDRDYRVVRFSNHGICVDIFAPGINLWTAQSYTSDSQLDESEMYSLSTGTSLSAPFVSGVLALLLEKYPDFNHREIREMLFDNAFKDVLKIEGIGNVYKSPNLLVKSPLFDETDIRTLVPIQTLSIFGEDTEKNESTGIMMNLGLVIVILLSLVLL
jgi:subtilisin family serine protease